ncbi:MAG: esterase/lipase family protein, partial [Arenibacterium sp.]
MRVLIFLMCFLFPLPATAGCIVLLHGLARTDASLAIMEQVFMARGYEVVNKRYPSTDQAIPILAEQTVPVA